MEQVVLSRIAELEAQLIVQSEMTQRQGCQIRTFELKNDDLRTRTWQLLTEFHLFPKLPREIRDLIWKKALPGPRIIEVLSGRLPHRAPALVSNRGGPPGGPPGGPVLPYAVSISHC